MQREECGIPEGIASIPCRSSCPLTGTCEMSSFSHNGSDVPFVVNRMHLDSAELVWMGACVKQNLVMHEADWLLETFLGSVPTKEAFSRLQICVLFTFLLLTFRGVCKIERKRVLALSFISVCPSVCVENLGSDSSLIFEYFTKIFREN